MLKLHITHQHTAATTTTLHSDQTPLSHNHSRYFFQGCAHKHPYEYMIQRDLVLESCASTSILTQRTQSLESRVYVQRSQTAVKYTCIYEGWNFNSGNYLFTIDTK